MGPPQATHTQPPPPPPPPPPAHVQPMSQANLMHWSPAHVHKEFGKLLCTQRLFGIKELVKMQPRVWSPARLHNELEKVYVHIHKGSWIRYKIIGKNENSCEVLLAYITNWQTFMYLILTIYFATARDGSRLPDSQAISFLDWKKLPATKKVRAAKIENELTLWYKLRSFCNYLFGTVSLNKQAVMLEKKRRTEHCSCGVTITNVDEYVSSVLLLVLF